MNHKIQNNKYRDWIKRTKGDIHRIGYTDRHQFKEWKQNMNSMREVIMDQYLYAGATPSYMVTRTYYYYEPDIRKVRTNNKRVNNVIDDLFNPRGTRQFHLNKDHYLERHKPDLIQNEEGEWVIQKGGFHVHTLLPEPDPRALQKPNSRIRKTYQRITGSRSIPSELTDTESGRTKLIKLLLTNALQERCYFINKGDICIDIVNTNDKYEYDGYTGWKGLVSYVTKNMYNNEMILEVYDKQNSSILTTTNTRQHAKNTGKTTEVDLLVRC